MTSYCMCVLKEEATTYPQTSPYLAWHSRSKASSPYKNSISDINSHSNFYKKLSLSERCVCVRVCYFSKVKHCPEKRQRRRSSYSQFFEMSVRPNAIPPWYGRQKTDVLKAAERKLWQELNRRSRRKPGDCEREEGLLTVTAGRKGEPAESRWSLRTRRSQTLWLCGWQRAGRQQDGEGGF